MGAAFVFGVSLAACAYIYVGYPALIFAVSRLRHQVVHKRGVYQRISVIIPVHNEEHVLEDKLANTLSLSYPGRPEILVVSDGSTDRSESIANAFASQGVRLIALERTGKAAALNAGAASAGGDILVFTDANSILETDGLLRLAENFADPRVGGVCGNKKYRVRRGSDTTEVGENLYWRYDKWQKQLESRVGSIFAADGTLYAIRRELYVALSDPAQADDIAISTRIVLAGFRLVYEPAAVAWEDAPVEGRDEFRRKIRVTNHSVRALLNLGSDLWTSGFYSIELLSHKLLRHFAPFALAPLFVSNLWIAGRHPALSILAALQVAFYTLAGAGYLLRHDPRGHRRILTVPYYFCMVNAAALFGVLSVARGRRLPAWSPRGGIS